MGWPFPTEHVVRRHPGGGYTVHYDPAIAVPFNALQPPKDIELWPQYEAIRCATLVIRGEQSDLLTRETAAQMGSRGPRAKVVEIPGVGHAPTLMHPGPIAVVRGVLGGRRGWCAFFRPGVGAPPPPPRSPPLTRPAGSCR